VNKKIDFSFCGYGDFLSSKVKKGGHDYILPTLINHLSYYRELQGLNGFALE